ncbi:SPW repeat protein [Alicyclobacillus acidiphilus]|uniref:SPW repeat protein n=1 Tax=Alicyclobacillus acidiphilus TaxID=182455 RepID=UPI000834AD26|nr:SPW repeat protein [Alicyclobacillus acidiphilus]
MKTQWKIVINALIGIWFILTPWVLNFSSDTAALWTSVVIGAIQTLASLAVFAQKRWNSAARFVWISFVTGLWFIVHPFVFQMQQNSGELWNFVILGVISAVLSFWYGWETSTESTDSRHGSGSRAQAAK